MTIKKEYSVGDTVWIYGISASNKLTQGTIIANLDLSHCGFADIQYIIEIPTHIEPLLEIRSWQTISQDDKGPVGSLRELGQDLAKENKKIRQLGYLADNQQDVNDDTDPTPDEIMAALEKSSSVLVHKPMNFKETNKPKRKYFPRKKKST